MLFYLYFGIHHRTDEKGRVRIEIDKHIYERSIEIDLNIIGIDTIYPVRGDKRCRAGARSALIDFDKGFMKNAVDKEIIVG